MAIESKEDAERIMDDEFDDGSMLLIKKTFKAGGFAYTYAAVKVGGLWYTTDRYAKPMLPADFVSWLARGARGHLPEAPEIFWAKTVHQI